MMPEFLKKKKKVIMPENIFLGSTLAIFTIYISKKEKTSPFA